jgi:2-polyprenyl-3-methyl-5-hydroxy-6-metoxy-1,4-benzoquinol methylase
LDVGCGSGHLLAALADKEVEYLGVDSSTELIKLARQNYPTKNFLVGDILKLEKIAGDFDYIFCLAVLPHLPGEKLRLQALRGMKDKLRVGGQIVISVWNLWRSAPGRPDYRPRLFKSWFLSSIGQNDLDFGDLIFPWKNSRGEAVSDRYYHAFRRRELKNLVAKAGLNLVELKIDPFNYWLILN